MSFENVRRYTDKPSDEASLEEDPSFGVGKDVPELDGVIRTDHVVPRGGRTHRRRTYLLLGAVAIVVAVLMIAIPVSRRGKGSEYTPPKFSPIGYMTDPNLACTKTKEEFWAETIVIGRTTTDNCRPSHPNDCTCKNPVLADNSQRSKSKQDSWDHGFQHNLQMIDQYFEESGGKQPDLVIFGGAVAEHWRSTSRGWTETLFKENNEIFEEYFGDRALVLGLTDDSTREMLYRVENGEMPDWLEPKVIWITLEETALSFEMCTSESIVAGYVALATEMSQRKPNAIIVLNSMFPYATADHIYVKGMWTDINNQVACFAATNEKYHFFNSTEIFLNDEGGADLSMQINAGDPTALGSEYWADQMIDFLNEILPEQNWEKPLKLH